MNHQKISKSYWDQFINRMFVYLTSYGFLFLFAYLAVVVLISLMINAGLTPVALSPTFKFLTSPVNPIEDFSSVYPSVGIGYYSNGVFVIVLLLVTQIYYLACYEMAKRQDNHEESIPCGNAC